jgi:nucleoside 2-deoxyribosyltransferase
MKIYLAGKIAPHDWRWRVVRDAGTAHELNEGGFGDQPLTLDGGRFRHHRCTGPFFLWKQHGSAHGPGTHGVGANTMDWNGYAPSNADVVSVCLDAIRRSDVVFAWFGRDGAKGAYGTVFEIGYAKALGTPVWIAGDTPLPDQWFAYTAADRTLWGVADPIDALIWYLEHSEHLPQGADVYMRQAADDPEAVKARRLFAEFGPPGVRVPIPRHVRSAVWAKTGGTCWYCKRPTNPYDDFEVDHVMPVSKGGANRIDNLVPCCKACNASKRDTILADR